MNGYFKIRKKQTVNFQLYLENGDYWNSLKYMSMFFTGALKKLNSVCAKKIHMAKKKKCRKKINSGKMVGEKKKSSRGNPVFTT